MNYLLLDRPQSLYISRLNLNEGRFLNPIFSRTQAVNACGHSLYRGLFACAGDNAILECFDLRICRSLGYQKVPFASETDKDNLTSLRFNEDGTHLAVGTSMGKIIIYDMRSSIPYVIKKHMFGLPIIDIKYQTITSIVSSKKIIVSSDAKIVKFWNTSNGVTCVSLKISQKYK